MSQEKLKKYSPRLIIASDYIKKNKDRIITADSNSIDSIRKKKNLEYRNWKRST